MIYHGKPVISFSSQKSFFLPPELYKILILYNYCTRKEVNRQDLPTQIKKNPGAATGIPVSDKIMIHHCVRKASTGCRSAARLAGHKVNKMALKIETMTAAHIISGRK